MRLQKHDLYMSEAKFASTRSTCHKKKAGAVLLVGNLTIKGYTGNLPNQKHCEDMFKEKGKQHSCTCNSAELNAIFQAVQSQNPITTFYGGTLYTTDTMDIHKASQLVSCGIKEIVYGKQNPNKKDLDELFQFATYNNVKLICYEDYNNILDENVNKVLLEVEDILSNLNQKARDN